MEEIGISNPSIHSALDEISEAKELKREQFVKQSINNAFSKMDSLLLNGELETSTYRWSGTSAAICYVENKSLYIGNVGDVHALYVKGDGTMVSLVEEHTPQNKKERQRISKTNGSVSVGYRSSLVNGVVSSTRGLGNHGDPDLKSSVICKPEITVVPIDPDDQFLILFSAGIWEVFDNQDVMFLLEDIMPDTAQIENLRKHFQSCVASSVENDSSLNANLSSQTSLDGLQSSIKRPVSTSHQYGLLSQGSPSDDTDGDNDSTPSGSGCSRSKVDDSGMDTRSRSMSHTEDSSSKETEICNKSLPPESKACLLARELVQRLSNAALLAGSRENITAMVIILKGCPVNLYLLPSNRSGES